MDFVARLTDDLNKKAKGAGKVVSVETEGAGMEWIAVLDKFGLVPSSFGTDEHGLFVVAVSLFHG